MRDGTIQSSLLELMQRSRKAMRLYTEMSKTRGNEGDLADVQAEEWKRANAELVRQLGMLLDHGAARSITQDVLTVRDYFLREYRGAESEMNLKQRELIRVVEGGNFVRSATLSRELVLLKARLQANQAAHHELDDLIVSFRITQPPIELHEELPPETNVELDAASFNAREQSRSPARARPHAGESNEGVTAFDRDREVPGKEETRPDGGGAASNPVRKARVIPLRRAQ